MLKAVSGKLDEAGASVPAGDAAFPSPFVSGLEYGAPARGTWNIVHTGMLVPTAHEIFVCSANCLRGVVLTAAEMNASDRFSTITVRENNVLEGDMEELIIEGVTDILNKLPKCPPAVLVYTSCIHHFMGCDLSYVYRKLRERFPGVDFTDCYMIPIMRKSGLTPEQLMRRQLYTLWKKRPLLEKQVNIIGNNVPTDESSELIKIIKKSGREIKDITLCNTYEEYQSMAESAMNISYLPVAGEGGKYLEEQFGQRHLYLPLCYGFDEIAKALNRLNEVLGLSKSDFAKEKEEAVNALTEAKEVIKDTPVAIDYTAVPRPAGLSRLLIENGFRVVRIYADSYTQEDKSDFEWLKKNVPELRLYATVQAQMRVLPRKNEKKLLAIGQKAAYFTGSDYFVNIVEGGGMYGFDGIVKLAGLMKEACEKPKNTRELIQRKGWRCDCCL